MSVCNCLRERKRERERETMYAFVSMYVFVCALVCVCKYTCEWERYTLFCQVRQRQKFSLNTWMEANIGVWGPQTLIWELLILSSQKDKEEDEKAHISFQSAATRKKLKFIVKAKDKQWNIYKFDTCLRLKQILIQFVLFFWQWFHRGYFLPRTVSGTSKSIQLFNTAVLKLGFATLLRVAKFQKRVAKL